MSLYDDNIKEIEALGFSDTHFGGYGATIFKKGDLVIRWGEWSYASIRVNDNESYELCQILTEPIKDKLLKVLNNI